MRLLQIIKTLFLATLTLLFFSFLLTQQSFAQQVSPTPPKAEFMKATVISVDSIKPNPYSDYHSSIETLNAVIQDGVDAGKTAQVQYDTQGISSLELNAGDTVILAKTDNPSGQATYSVESKYRLAPISIIAITFVLLVVL